MLAFYTTSEVSLATRNMNKDAIFATLIGLGIGLLLTAIILVGPNIVKSLPHLRLPSFPKISITLPSFSFPKKTTPTPTNTSTKNTAHAVTVTSPLPEEIEQSTELLVSGSTSAHASVVIQGTIDDIVVVANDQGQYAGKITLSEGKNTILVTSYSTKQEVATQEVTVYYTPEQW